ncbi:phospholipase C accessory protein PlcR [Dyella tabacisoli]|uniref:Phospholipase C accessory protein PlcR n=1 Tax=Dyella tabacisoli TaxID=2282381 RepID=A0A369UK70_9GAMM|nr:phospholipase C accessory protein PlcR [Dyella tabacisoli]RDD79990.1 phospholipase C accessory protein PlcR [Dyella tabacisoli]
MSKSRTIWSWLALASAVLVAIVAWSHIRQPATARSGSTNESVAATSVAQQATAVAAPPVLSRHRGAGPAESALNVRALQKELASRPDAESEIKRIVAFARFRDDVTAYGADRGSMSPDQRRSEARRIMSELAGHVANNEILPLQAEAMSAVLLTDAESDPALRDAEIRNVKQQWNAYSQQTVGPSPALDPRHQAYVRQSTQIIQDVQSKVADPAQQQAIIASRLQALRSQLYDAASPH